MIGNKATYLQLAIAQLAGRTGGLLTSVTNEEGRNCEYCGMQNHGFLIYTFSIL